MNKTFDISKKQSGFSLAEILAALMIGSMVLIAILAVYNRAERAAAGITRKLDSTRLPSEILQRIAEDLDGIISADAGTKITIENKIEAHGFQTARLEIVKTIFDKADKPQVFEKIIWQTAYDYGNEGRGLVLYRSHSGIAAEDKLLDEQKEKWERELFVPVCTRITFFSVRVPVGSDFQNSWTNNALPAGVVVTISFAEPVKTPAGSWDVPETEKITRTVAVDRTRKIKFIIPVEKSQDQLNENSEEVATGQKDKSVRPKEPNDNAERL